MGFYPHSGFHFSLASQAGTHQTKDIHSGIYGKDILQLMEAKETCIVKTHDPSTLTHSHKELRRNTNLQGPLPLRPQWWAGLGAGPRPSRLVPGGARPTPASRAGARRSPFCPSFPAGARRDSSSACALRRWAPRPARRPSGSPLCACALALPPSRRARLSQSVCRSLSSEQEEQRDFGEPAARLFSFPSLSPAPHLSSPLSCPRSRSHGGAVGGHSVPVCLLVVLRGRAFGARRREPWSLPRPGGEELRLLLCG